MPKFWFLQFGIVVVLLFPFSLDGTWADDRATVVKVVDGDTLDVLVNGQEKRIRLIGVDTSELHESDKLIRDAKRSSCTEADLQELGAQATQFVSHLLSPGAAVRLEYGRRRYDDHQRILAFVWLADGRLLNELLLCEGYAQALLHYVFRSDYRTRFQQCGQRAQAEGKGLWPAGCWTTTHGSQPNAQRASFCRYRAWESQESNLSSARVSPLSPSALGECRRLCHGNRGARGRVSKSEELSRLRWLSSSAQS